MSIPIGVVIFVAYLLILVMHESANKRMGIHSRVKFNSVELAAALSVITIVISQLLS